MTRRHDGGNRRGDATTGTPSSVPEVGRLLRRARTRQGLHLEDVAARTGLNLHQLEALETGTVDRIPDRVVVLQTLRRYADFLGLPGDRFVLAVVDHWPSPTAAPPVVPVAPRPVAAVAPAAVAATTAVAVGPPSAPTGTVPVSSAHRVGSPVHVTPHPTGVPSTTAQVNAVPSARPPSATAPVPAVPNTGVIPAVRPQATPRVRGPSVDRRALGGDRRPGRRRRAGRCRPAGPPLQPRWLSDIGITQAPTTPTTAASASGSHGHHRPAPPPDPDRHHHVAQRRQPDRPLDQLPGHGEGRRRVLLGAGHPVRPGRAGLRRRARRRARPRCSRSDGSLQVEVGSVSAHVVVGHRAPRPRYLLPPAAP